MKNYKIIINLDPAIYEIKAEDEETAKALALQSFQSEIDPRITIVSVTETMN